MIRNKTIGSVVSDLSQKQTEKTSIVEQQTAMQEDYMKNLTLAVDRGYKKYDGDFFIHVETKAEKLLPNTFRNYFIDRLTCPTPNYDQSVFRYNRKSGQIEYLWTIPDRETCFHLKDHALEVVAAEQGLLSFVLKFDDGTLFKMMKKYNGEKLESIEIKKD